VGRAVKQVTVSLKEFLCPVTVVNVKIDAGDSLEAVLLPRPIGALASHMYSNAGASSAIGFVGVRFQSNDLKIVFYNQKGASKRFIAQGSSLSITPLWCTMVLPLV
jgi:hypothetical protein